MGRGRRKLNTKLTEREPEPGADAGWAQAGCLFAAPGMLVGLALGLGVWTHLKFTGVIGLLLLPIGGAGAALMAGGFVATAMITLGNLIHLPRRVIEIASYAAWFLASLIAPFLLAWFIWAWLGW